MSIITSWKMNCIKLHYVINTSIIYFDYVFVYLYFFRNVITNSLCAIYVWILWWSRTLCTWEQMTRWMTLKNLVLKNIVIQYSDRMWHWSIGFYINCMKSWTTLFWAEMILLFIWTHSIMMLEKWMWTFYPFEMFLFKCVLFFFN